MAGEVLGGVDAGDLADLADVVLAQFVHLFVGVGPALFSQPFIEPIGGAFFALQGGTVQEVIIIAFALGEFHQFLVYVGG